MDIKEIVKEKIEEIVTKIKSDEKIKEKFMSDPISAVEELIGIDLPNDEIQKIVDAVKAKIAVDDIGKGLGALKGLFGKK